MDALGNHEYILSLLEEFDRVEYLRGELTHVVGNLTMETAEHVAGILRTIESSHLPLSYDMIVTCIIGGP